jgi:UDP-N-acetyl-D-glucosamine dehydrogenase
VGARVVVVGQGYVGLPLALGAAEAGFKVSGIEIDQDKVAAINTGHSPVEDVPHATIAKLIAEGQYKVQSDYESVAEAEIVLLAVPSPLTPDRTPDLTHIVEAATEVAKSLRPGTLVILESTIYPGVTRSVLAPLLAEVSGLNADDIDVAYSPERIDPTNKTWTLANTPKLVSGLSAQATTRAADFYRTFINDVVLVDTPEIAETAKLLENTFRFVNISLINELAEFCHRAGIPILDVIDAAASKPFGFMKFTPSAGVGGHCISVDPHFLSYAANLHGVNSQFIALADKINRELPDQIVRRAEDLLGTQLDGKTVLIIGVAYKPNVADTRETPAAPLIDALRARGSLVTWHDEHVKDWRGEKSEPIDNTHDLAILVTAHMSLDLAELGLTPLLDTTWRR